MKTFVAMKTTRSATRPRSSCVESMFRLVRRITRWPAGLLLTALAPAPVAAADPPVTPTEGAAPDLTHLSLEELGDVRVDTVYGASKHVQKVTEAPSAVSIVTRDDIKKFGYRTISDVLRSVRGFYMAYDRTYGYVGIRGFNQPGDFGGRVLMLVNGHRINEPIFDSAMADSSFLTDVDLIDRVEVVRGAGSVLYGNNAFFGVINVVTRRAGDVNGTELSGSVASYDTYQGRVTYGRTFTNGLELLVSGTLYESHGPDRLYVREFDTPDQNNGVAQDFDGDRFGSVFTSLRYRGFTFEGGYVSREKDSPLVPYGTLFNDHRQHPIDSRGYAAVGWNGSVAGEWETSVRGYYDFYGLAVDYPSNTADPGYPPVIALNRERDSAQWVGLEGQASRTYFERLRLTLGTELRHDFSLKIRSVDLNPYDVVGSIDDQATRVGAFAQGELAIRTNLMVNVGVRYDYYSTFGQAVNPRAALIYGPWDKTTFKFLYGEAYRAPNLWEYAFKAPFQRPNPDLDPETVRSYEVVWEQYLPANLRLSLSGFYNQTQDLIVQTLDPSGDFIVFRNVDETSTKGMEFEVQHTGRRGLLARASYSLQRTENVETHQELSNSPRHLVKGNLAVPLLSDKVHAGVEVQYSSSARTTPGRTIRRADDYWVANLTLFSRELFRNLELSATLYNLFDKRYAYPAGEELVPELIWEDGRTFRVKLSYRF